MYCINCGNKINNNDKFCTKCGNKINNNINSNVNNNVESKKYNGMKNASIILGIISIAGIFLIILSPISLIISIIGLILAFYASKKESNLPGILLNSIGLVISLVISIVLIFVIIFVIDEVNNSDFYNDEYSDYNNEYSDYNDDWGFGDYSEKF